MPEVESERLSSSAKKRLEQVESEVAELKKAVTALIKFVKNFEDDQDEPYMPTGVYYGTEFQD